MKKLNPSCSFELPKELQIAIIDRSDLDGKMSTERWLEVEKRVLMAIAYFDSDDSDEGISYDGAGWERGVEVVGCSNKKSLDFCNKRSQELRRTLAMCKTPGGSQIVTAIAEYSLGVDPPVLGDEIALKIIKKINRGLKIQDWRIISSVQSKNGNGNDVVRSIDEQSLQELKKMKGSVEELLNLEFPMKAKVNPPRLQMVQANLHHCEA